MGILRFFILLLLVSIIGSKPDNVPVNFTDMPSKEHKFLDVKGALLLTRFKSLDEFKSVVHIEYFNVIPRLDLVMYKKPLVRLTHYSNGREVTSILESGTSELDLLTARDGGFWDRVRLGLKSPYTVIHKNDILRVYNLARRRNAIFGFGDVAFYDFAETTMFNICEDDTVFIRPLDFSEKGYINTFNHITAQAFMTSIFTERLADFMADLHELGNMPELITGKFSEDQILDIENGVVDNYLDMINNEWGQELGKLLKSKYNITRKTHWTPELLANYLNDIQGYYSWAFQIGFNPYRASDEKVMRFSSKINTVMKDVSGLR